MNVLTGASIIMYYLSTTPLFPFRPLNANPGNDAIETFYFVKFETAKPANHIVAFKNDISDLKRNLEQLEGH